MVKRKGFEHGEKEESSSNPLSSALLGLQVLLYVFSVLIRLTVWIYLMFFPTLVKQPSLKKLLSNPLIPSRLPIKIFDGWKVMMLKIARGSNYHLLLQEGQCLFLWLTKQTINTYSGIQRLSQFFSMRPEKMWKLQLIPGMLEIEGSTLLQTSAAFNIRN